METHIILPIDFLPYLLPWARRCQCLHPLASSSKTPLIGCVSHAWLPIPSNLSKSDRVVFIKWSPSGYTPVISDCLDRLSSLCLLITGWQLVKAHRVARNEPKIRHMLYNQLWNLKYCLFNEKNRCWRSRFNFFSWQKAMTPRRIFNIN